MNPLLLILLKLLGSSALLTGFYFLLFRGKSSYTTGRIFLLCIPLFSLAFSLINVKAPISEIVTVSSLLEQHAESVTAGMLAGEAVYAAGEEIPAAAVAAETAAGAAAVPAASEKEAGGMGAMLIIYLAAATLITGLLILEMSRLGGIRRRADRRVIMGSPTFFSEEIKASFSVMRSIYVSPQPSQEKLSIIIHHEKQHIRHRHYIDLALAELFMIVMWFNPFVWIIRRELRSIHEFQADSGVLNGGGVQMQRYMMAILEECTGSVPVMANGLSGSLIKRRFMNMKKGLTIRHKALRIALTLPFAAALFVFFSFTAAPAENSGPGPAVSLSDSLKGFKRYSSTYTKLFNNTTDPDKWVKANPVTVTVREVYINSDKAGVDSLFEKIQSRIEQLYEAQEETRTAPDPVQVRRIIEIGGQFSPEVSDLFEKMASTGLPQSLIDSVNIYLKSYRAEKVMQVRPVADPNEWKKHDPRFAHASVNDIPENYTPAGFASHFNVTIKDDDMLYTPDGDTLMPVWAIKSLTDYNGKFVSNKRTVIPDSSKRIFRIERNDKETLVTVACKLYWDWNWIFRDKETCLIDEETGDRYMIRDIVGDEEVGRMSTVYGLKGKTIEQTLVFPPLKKKVKVVSFYEPDNYVDLPTYLNGGGLRVYHIKLDDYTNPATKNVKIFR